MDPTLMFMLPNEPTPLKNYARRELVQLLDMATQIIEREALDWRKKPPEELLEVSFHEIDTVNTPISTWRWFRDPSVDQDVRREVALGFRTRLVAPWEKAIRVGRPAEAKRCVAKARTHYTLLTTILSLQILPSCTVLGLRGLGMELANLWLKAIRQDPGVFRKSYGRGRSIPTASFLLGSVAWSAALCSIGEDSFTTIARKP